MCKDFIYKMLSESGAISSKRVIAIVGAMVLFGIIIFSVVSGKSLDYHVYDGLIVVVLGAAGITAFEKVKGLPDGISQAANKIDSGSAA